MNNKTKERLLQFIENEKISKRKFCEKISVSESYFTKDYILNANIGYGRSKHYKVLANQLQDYKKNVRLHDLDYSFALGFQVFLRSQGNVQNTINTKFRMLKCIVHYAQKKGFLKEDPLVDIKVKEVKSIRNFLDESELKRLEILYTDIDLPKHLKNTLQYFLFSCYTGLRYSDVRALKRNDITQDAIHITQEKTGKPILIPLIDKAKKLLDYNRTGYLFDVLSNEKSNKNLKAIAAAADINKTLTYHTSRHTFATLSIYFGIPMEVVAELLGVDNRTVKIYAKIMEQVKFVEMKKWG